MNQYEIDLLITKIKREIEQREAIKKQGPGRRKVGKSFEAATTGVKKE